ncbi:MAG: AraC family transcriptional regulator [Acidobacteriota bacterium]|nr:AraC family transcriptional regulator [Acidobacteriota bacterium]
MTARQVQSRIWRPETGGLTLIASAGITQAFPRHCHDHFVIAATESGVGGSISRTGLRRAGPGSLMIIHPGEIHTGYPVCPPAWSYRAVYPDAALFPEMIEADAGNPRATPFFRDTIIDDAHLAEEFLGAHRMLESPHEALEGQSRMLGFLGTLAARHASRWPQPPPADVPSGPLARARDYLESAYHQNVTLAEMAGIANLSVFHFLRAFNRQFGLTPHAYLNQVRVHQARELILRGVPIARAAVDVGFVDQSHLTKRFKRLLGVTPGQVLPQAAVAR